MTVRVRHWAPPHEALRAFPNAPANASGRRPNSRLYRHLRVLGRCQPVHKSVGKGIVTTIRRFRSGIAHRAAGYTSWKNAPPPHKSEPVRVPLRAFRAFLSHADGTYFVLTFTAVTRRRIHSTGETSSVTARCTNVPTDGCVRPRSTLDMKDTSIPESSASSYCVNPASDRYLRSNCPNSFANRLCSSFLGTSQIVHDAASFV